jgi:superfamily II DNA or RNA helicase
MTTNSYDDFLNQKTHVGCDHGFEPVWMPDMLFPFQRALVEWACRKGRGAVFADCGLGKTGIQLTVAENWARKTGGRVLILTPLAVAFQTVREGKKFGVEVTHRRDGLHAGDKIVVTNYERLHHFKPDDFDGVVCDESSVLKNFDGETRKAVTDFMRKRPYRMLCTATAAPNDYIELGTSSEALGDLGSQDMMNRFFKREKDFTKINNAGGQGWEMRPHAERDFWRWVCSWARAMRKPSDMGFDDGAFKLPELITRQHCVKASRPMDGYLFDIPAVGLQEQRSDLRRTIGERCSMAAQLINAHDQPAVAWCNLNEEGNRLAKEINGAVEVSGNDSEEHKEETFAGFIKGDIRVLVTKPVIGGFGLNLQHCAHQTYFPSHSYEQFYQSVRRCWRFGQKRPVVVDMITTDGQENVLANLQRKSEQAAAMFENLVSMMWRELRIEKTATPTKKEQVPSWL